MPTKATPAKTVTFTAKSGPDPDRLRSVPGGA